MTNKDLRLAIIRYFDSQANFAQHLGIPEPTVSRILNGRQMLKADDARMWAEALRCSKILMAAVTEKN